MDDITSDFDCLKVSALGKAARISRSVRYVTIGPDSVLDPEHSPDKENAENQPNNLNVEDTGQAQQLTSPKSRSKLKFSIARILLENECQRKEEVKRAKGVHLQSMEKSALALKKQTAILQATMVEKRMVQERAAAEELARLEVEEERLEQQTEMYRRHERQLQLQRICEDREKLEREIEEQRKMNEKKELIEKTARLHATFRAKYQDTISVSKSCKDRNAGSALAPHAAKLKELSQRMEALVEKSRSEDLTEADVNTAKVIVSHSEDVLEEVRYEIERINHAYDAEIARREDKVREAQIQAQAITQAQELENYQAVHPEQLPEQVETNGTVPGADQATAEYKVQSEINVPILQVQLNVPNVQAQENVHNVPSESKGAEASNQSLPAESDTGGMHKFVDEDSLQLCLDSQQLLETYRASYQPLLQSDSTKKFRFECQKAINVPVNAISGRSGEELMEKYAKLHQFLSGGGSVNANQHPQGITYCKDMLAKKFVSQGETLASSTPDMAFSYAAVAIGLWNEHPDFGDLLLAHFRRICPYLVPIFLPRQEDQSNEDYYKSLGYKYDAEKKEIEKQDLFLKRMAGVVRLYAALMVTRQRRGVTKPHPHGVQNAWRWLAAILNIEPRPEVCPTLIVHMLEVVGNALWTAYPRQFPKMLKLLAGKYFPRMKSKDGTGGQMSRLENFLQMCLTKGTIPPPQGQLSPNFW